MKLGLSFEPDAGTYSSDPWNGDLYLNNMNPGWFSLAAIALKPQQIPMFLHISTRVWERQWYTHTSEHKGSMLKPQ